MNEGQRKHRQRRNVRPKASEVRKYTLAPSDRQRDLESGTALPCTRAASHPDGSAMTGNDCPCQSKAQPGTELFLGREIWLEDFVLQGFCHSAAIISYEQTGFPKALR